MALRGVIAYIGVGSNLEEPLRQCRLALQNLDAVNDTRLLRASSFYRTEPVGVREQDAFINAAAEIRTELSPRTLLEALKAIEQEMGRRKSLRRWGPRVIDLDILLYGQDIVQEDDLVIPHPELHKRRFVLAPLCEISSYVIHPAFGISMQGLLIRLENDDRNVVVKIQQADA
ncbi:MAG: 2-amino-4-hydroxy-6-hydroxymethyldihydropteridine diphosphokinase [Syntrophales bacterium]|jgi:2-amino-4-hydroxy-6-hydroxymethyldihydropteridine diphosphokinase|nr:2-amino-4-hydroxy-6-hydroxymethyldihydropteridine diphosphokinase [Syntrophales bacterium]MCK9391289.1 2-amino-4-hydroxy-6-hydroxymethyldihydropteridine diphosphokinase [Syntrophales bacterium]